MSCFLRITFDLFAGRALQSPKPQTDNFVAQACVKRNRIALSD